MFIELAFLGDQGSYVGQTVDLRWGGGAQSEAPKSEKASEPAGHLFISSPKWSPLGRRRCRMSQRRLPISVKGGSPLPFYGMRQETYNSEFKLKLKTVKRTGRVRTLCCRVIVEVADGSTELSQGVTASEAL